MTEEQTPEPRDRANDTAPAALGRALQRTQALLRGRGRWRDLAILAAMAGVAGVGVQPPPLGMLQPVLADADLRPSLLHALAPGLPLILLLGLVLLGFAPVARAFSLLFMHAVVTGEMQPAGYRQWLGAGLRHFVWSSALSLPLYAVLFGGEWMVAGGEWQRLLTADESQLPVVLAAAAAKFLLVLVPWALVTLPAMVAIYELTPAAMVGLRVGPVAAFGQVMRSAWERPGRFAGYLALRLLVQVAGTPLATIALVLGLALVAVPAGLIVGLGWGIAALIGDPATAGGAAALSFTGLLGLVLLYVAVCALLVPVSALVYAFAVEITEAVIPGRARTGARTG